MILNQKHIVLFIFLIGLNKANLNYLIKCHVWESPPSLGCFSLSLIGWQTESKLYYNSGTQTPHHHSPATELFVSFGVWVLDMLISLLAWKPTHRIWSRVEFGIRVSGDAEILHPHHSPACLTDRWFDVLCTKSIMTYSHQHWVWQEIQVLTECERCVQMWEKVEGTITLTKKSYFQSCKKNRKGKNGCLGFLESIKDDKNTYQTAFWVCNRWQLRTAIRQQWKSITLCFTLC